MQERIFATDLLLTKQIVFYSLRFGSKLSKTRRKKDEPSLRDYLLSWECATVTVLLFWKVKWNSGCKCGNTCCSLLRFLTFELCTVCQKNQLNYDHSSMFMPEISEFTPIVARTNIRTSIDSGIGMQELAFWVVRNYFVHSFARSKVGQIPKELG